MVKHLFQLHASRSQRWRTAGKETWGTTSYMSNLLHAYSLKLFFGDFWSSLTALFCITSEEEVTASSRISP